MYKRQAQHRAIDAGLRAIAAELSSGVFTVSPGDEDIHTAVERRLFELAGPVAGMLHTGRSRNDQVATDLRMWARRACTDLLVALAGLQEALMTRAGEHRTDPMPGYTHLQRAQVVSLGHHLLAYVEMFGRDGLRLEMCIRDRDQSARYRLRHRDRRGRGHRLHAG